MCRFNRFNLVALFFLVAMLFSQHSFALGKEAPLLAEDPVVEARMLKLSEDLRCLVCQNESIAESRADFSNDLRREIREQIHANKTDEEILEFMVERYGDFVLYDPPLKATTFFLWFGPLILLVIGFIALMLVLKRRRVQVEEIPELSETERKQAENLMSLEDTGEKPTDDSLDTAQVNVKAAVNENKAKKPQGKKKGNKE